MVHKPVGICITFLLTASASFRLINPSDSLHQSYWRLDTSVGGPSGYQYVCMPHIHNVGLFYSSSYEIRKLTFWPAAMVSLKYSLTCNERHK